MKKLIIYGIILCPLSLLAQVGINTENPQQILHVDGQKDNPSTGTPTDAQQRNDVVITENGQIGIGVNNPTRNLDIEGTARLSENQTANKPVKLGYTHSSASGNPTNNTARPLYVKEVDGQLVYAPNGYTTVVGGNRPFNHTSASRTMPIKTFPVNSPTIARVQFVHYPKSSVANNQRLGTYTYGNFTIINYHNGSNYEIKIIDVSIRDYQGSQKTLEIQDDHTIQWSLYGTEKARIVLNQTTGELGFFQHTGIYDYFFEILGGS